MRVVAGKYKRTPLKTIDSLSTRPTKDMVKEALFSSIYIDEDTSFLDLFSGSGAIGIEALSRGAKEVYFNDLNKDAVKVINENLNKLKENRIVYNLNYDTCLFKLRGNQFDYIFLDPPYSFKEYENVFNLIGEYNLLNDNGKIIVEVKKDVELDDNICSLNKYKEKKYGISKLIYYRREDVKRNLSRYF